MTSDPQSAPMGEQELIALAEACEDPATFCPTSTDLRNIAAALRAAASPRLAGREEIAALQAISDGYTGKIEHGYLVVENPKATPQSIALGGVDPNLAVNAAAILSLLGPAPSESVVITDEMVERGLCAWHPDMGKIVHKMGGWSKSFKDDMRRVLTSALSAHPSQKLGSDE